MLFIINILALLTKLLFNRLDILNFDF